MYLCKDVYTLIVMGRIRLLQGRACLTRTRTLKYDKKLRRRPWRVCVRVIVCVCFIYTAFLRYETSQQRINQISTTGLR